MLLAAADLELREMQIEAAALPEREALRLLQALERVAAESRALSRRISGH
jgi:hypothetical protein